MTAMRLTTLASGLRVATHAMPGLQTAAVGLFAEVGSRDEPAELNGIAHLFEHMVFKGAGGRSARAISEAIEEVGGDLNAATERDSTSFTASVMAEHVPLAVELVADLVLRPHFEPGDLQREKDVVLQELAEARDNPCDMVFDQLWSVAFEGQALGRSILGEEATIGAVTVADLIRWRDDHYRGPDIALVAAGKVDHDQLVELAEHSLAGLPAGPRAPRPIVRFTGGARIGRHPAEQAQLMLGFPAPADGAADHYAARLFCDILGGGASSRLFQQVREDRGLAYSVSSALHPHADTGLLYVHAATARSQAAAALQLIEEIVRYTAVTATQRELERVRTQARAGLLMALETPWGQAHYLARMLAVHGRLVDPAKVIDSLAAVTLEEVRAYGARMVAGPAARATIGLAAARAA
ncbi:MAG TPA: pitrilysin family protein [Sphingomicrobium sp.]|jgi:predicted Zn-dependent peptidase|nr:pitrilysin family protein [Sphingomicrobium sp.]